MRRVLGAKVLSCLIFLIRGIIPFAVLMLKVALRKDTKSGQIAYWLDVQIFLEQEPILEVLENVILMGDSRSCDPTTDS